MVRCAISGVYVQSGVFNKCMYRHIHYYYYY